VLEGVAVSQDWSKASDEEIEARAQRYVKCGVPFLETLARRYLAQREEIQQAREALWLGHGHTGLYGDDGEMQCGLCKPAVDFKRQPIVELVGALKEEIRRLQQEVGKYIAAQKLIEMVVEGHEAAIREVMAALDKDWCDESERLSNILQAALEKKP